MKIKGGLLAGLALLAGATLTHADQVTHEEVSRAIELAVEFLRAEQREDGSWPYQTPEHVQGSAALAVLALSEAGVPEDDPAIQRGINYFLEEPVTEIYNAACIAMALASVNPARHIRHIARMRDFLVSAQNARGMWSYRRGDPLRVVGDNSNTQFAMLGLQAAISVGLSVDEDALRQAERHYESSQNTDGGWGYRPGDPTRGSMTAAGVASLYILGSSLYVHGEECGEYQHDTRIAAAMGWLERNYSVRTHPQGPDGWVYYWLYALERVGVLSGLRTIGGNDWYLDGSRFIVDTQNEDGSWMAGRDRVPNTCLAVLFLAKGNAPVLINKLMHSGEWNADMHDAQNLSAYVSQLFGQNLSWQVVSLDDSVETLMSAPILYITGHRWPELSPEESARLHAYIERGGFIFAEACCGREEFDEGFRLFMRDAFPDRSLERLESTHGVYRSWFRLTDATPQLEGIHAGCRTPIIYSARDLSCAWERNRPSEEREEFEFGANIAAYATGRERLQPRLEQRASQEITPLVPAAPGAFTFAQAMYSGQWNPHPGSGPKLLRFLNEEAGLPVAAEQVNIPLTDPNLHNYPFLYMTGLHGFVLTEPETTALADYLQRGGVLFADAAGGQEAFDGSFRAMLRDVLDDSRLEEIPPDSPIYDMAFDVRRVTYTAAVREQSPHLEVFTLYGAKVNGRWAVIYSPYDIGCALDGFSAYGIRGLVTDDAFRAATNIVLYSLTY